MTQFFTFNYFLKMIMSTMCIDAHVVIKGDKLMNGLDRQSVCLCFSRALHKKQYITHLSPSVMTLTLSNQSVNISVNVIMRHLCCLLNWMRCSLKVMTFTKRMKRRMHLKTND